MYQLLRCAAHGSDLVGMYHASLTPETKKQTQDIAATCGICVLLLTVMASYVLGHTDIDLVVVLGMPDTITEFYQVNQCVHIPVHHVRDNIVFI